MSIPQTGGVLNRPLKTMTARDGTHDMEEGIPLQDFSPIQGNFSQGQAGDDNRENRFAIISR